MVVFDLTPAMMEAGAQLLALLQKAKHRVVACGWVYTEEEGRWQLIIAFPDRRLRSSWDAYEAIYALTSKVPDGDEILRPGVVRARSDREPMAIALQQLAPRLQGKPARRLHYTATDNMILDSVYLYRVEPVPRARRARRARPA